jgi:hypothetical protein
MLACCLLAYSLSFSSRSISFKRLAFGVLLFRRSPVREMRACPPSSSSLGGGAIEECSMKAVLGIVCDIFALGLRSAGGTGGPLNSPLEGRFGSGAGGGGSWGAGAMDNAILSVIGGGMGLFSFSLATMFAMVTEAAAAAARLLVVGPLLAKAPLMRDMGSTSGKPIAGVLWVRMASFSGMIFARRRLFCR